MRAAYAASDAVLLDRHGEVLHELRVDAHGRRLEWTPLAAVSPAMQRIAVQAEDQRFFSHAGVDWLALAHAALRNLFSAAPRGASTITMQLAAQLDPAHRPRAGKRSLAEKWRQIEAARALEQRWSKHEILEAYLNLASFRGEVQGIAAASRALFGKRADGLDEAEALLLTALLRNPAADPARAARRACGLARRIAPHAGCEAIAARARGSLAGSHAMTPRAAVAPHVARRLLKLGMERSHSTLDGELQRFALEALQHQLNLLEKQNVADGAVLVVDNASGEVLAYVGNSGASASARFVDGVMAPRQAGSTLKPFLYEVALEQRLLTAASLIDDSPVNLVTPSGLYVPQNYDREFKGLVSARTSLAGSLNVPAVRTLMLVGADAFVARLKALGFDTVTEDGDYYGYALALGSPEVRLWDLVNAYRTLANGGVWSPLTLTRGAGEGTRTRAMDAAAAYIIADILSDRAARSVTFGLENPLATRFWSAVKTGTSKDMRDNWCVGFSGRYTVGVWIGNFSGASMWDVSGVSGAAPLWLDIMNYLHRADPGRAPRRPAGVVAGKIAFERGVEAPRQELFLAGTDTTAISVKAPAAQGPRIVYPGNGSVIALDPDIPAARQRVRFVARPAAHALHWRLNGEPLASAGAAGESVVLWRPEPGRHVLSVADASGIALDEIEFEVRGTATRR
ncbi:MAG: penicillin-binding protein 1C [Betaproteobacteria bacterium]|nr:penicillin-binding protein 1C [Betaproteobacteria bacterium]